MQENITEYGTTLHHPEHQLNEINNLAHSSPSNLPISPTPVLKMG